MWKAESGWWTTASEEVEVEVEVDVELFDAELEFEFEVDPLLVFEVVRFGANYTIRQKENRLTPSSQSQPSHYERRTLIFLFLFPFFPFFPLAFLLPS